MDNNTPIVFDNEASRDQALRAIDVHVGGRLRLRRALLGMSQEYLAEKLELSFQQVQKYERGINRISASRLFAIAEILDVPISFFFDDQKERSELGGSLAYRPPGTEPTDDNILEQQETLRLVRAYFRIADPTVRQKMLSMLKSLASED